MTVHDLKTCPQALLEAYIPSKFWFKHFLVHGPYLNLLQVTPEIKDASKAVFSAAKGKGLINQQTLQQMCLGWGLLWLSSHWELLHQKMHQFTQKKNHHHWMNLRLLADFLFFLELSLQTLPQNLHQYTWPIHPFRKLASHLASHFLPNRWAKHLPNLPVTHESMEHLGIRIGSEGVTYARWKWKTYGCFRK